MKHLLALAQVIRAEFRWALELVSEAVERIPDDDGPLRPEK